MRGLAVSLIRDGKIKTTEAKAKELRPYVEKLITKGRVPSVPTRRLLESRLGGQKETAARLVKEISPKYMERKGGYTRIVKLPKRKGDASSMAIIELI